MSIFGDIFDFDGDGKTDTTEELMGLYLIEKLAQDEEQQDDTDSIFHGDEE